MINSVLLRLSDTLLGLSQFDKSFKSKLKNLFNYLIDLLIRRGLASSEKW